jgi:lysophospholipase L1-like esterase
VAQSWVPSWATAQQIAEPENMLSPEILSGATLRQVVHLSIPGSAFRVQLSNAFGNEPLHLLTVHVARPAGPGAIAPASDRTLTFSGRPDVVIPPGASYLSDPVEQPLSAGSDLAISIQYEAAPLIETGHPGSRATSYVLAGNHVADAALPGAKTVDHWYQVAAVEVVAPPGASAVVALGDSITDGRGSTTNGNNRWTNVAEQTLIAAGHPISVLNAGLGGNCILKVCLGPPLMARLDRDMLAQPGVKAVVVLEGINDLGTLTREHPAPLAEHARLVTRLIAAYQQIAARAHAHGLRAYIGTIMPFMGSDYYHPDALNDADRNTVNAWIRVQKEFDGVIDFDRLMRDPAHPDHLNPAYDFGDFLHPNPAGHRLMGEAVAKALMSMPNKSAVRPRHKKRLQ